MWPDDFLRFKDLVQEDNIVFAVASVERSREEPGLVVQRLLTMEQVEHERTTGVVLNLRLDSHTRQHLEQAGRILQRAKGACPVFLCISDTGGKRMMMKAGEEYRVNPKAVARAELETLLGPSSVFFSRQNNGNGRNGR